VFPSQCKQREANRHIMIAAETIMQFAECHGIAGLATFIAAAVWWTVLIQGFFVSLLLSCIGMPSLWT
jgi:hypothetical protein